MARTVNSGTASYLQLAADVAALDIVGTALTIAAWVKSTGSGTNQVCIAKGFSSITARQYRLTNNGGALSFDIGDSAGEENVSAAGIANNVWAHWGAVKNGTGAGALRAFLNGVVTIAASSKTIQDTTARLTIGQFDDGVYGIAADVAELAIWDVALSDAELAALAKGVSPLFFRRTSLRGYWPLYGVAFPEADLSGYANHLPQVGTVASASHAPVSRITPRT